MIDQRDIDAGERLAERIAERDEREMRQWYAQRELDQAEWAIERDEVALHGLTPRRPCDLDKRDHDEPNPSVDYRCFGRGDFPR